MDRQELIETLKKASLELNDYSKYHIIVREKIYALSEEMKNCAEFLEAEKKCFDEAYILADNYVSPKK